MTQPMSPEEDLLDRLARMTAERDRLRAEYDGAIERSRKAHLTIEEVEAERDRLAAEGAHWQAEARRLSAVLVTDNAAHNATKAERGRLAAALRVVRNELWIHASAASAAGTVMDRESSWTAIEAADAVLREVTRNATDAALKGTP